MRSSYLVGAMLLAPPRAALSSSVGLDTPRLGRLRAILDSIPAGDGVAADIGTDHGILAVALHRKGLRVHATDISPLSAKGAESLFGKLGLSEAISLDVGFGLRPLLKYASVHTTVLSGMGTAAVLQILCDDESATFRDEGAGCGFDFSVLRQLGVHRVVLQPWPPNIVSLHYLHKAMLTNGWSYDEQRIKKFGRYHHLTTSFVRGTGAGSVDDATVIDAAPLMRKYARRTDLETDREELETWRHYLTKQLVSVRSKICGLGAAEDDASQRALALSRLLLGKLTAQLATQR